MSEVRFSVDPRLTALLAAGYRSSEVALKELVDNAWDADAANVWITLPEPLSSDPIVISDDGSGMTSLEVSEEYLKVARDKRSRTGDRTPRLGRKIKGRKGIGKFAGLTLARTMQVETKARGVASGVILDRDRFLNTDGDLEALSLPLTVKSVSVEDVGTTITLTNLDDRLNFPTPERLREVLIYEYGREDGFRVFVNGAGLSVEDIPGVSVDVSSDLLEGKGSLDLRFTVASGKKPPRRPDIILKVNGKAVGAPQMFNLDEDEEIPKNLLRRVYGELELTGADEFVTADWGAVIENNRVFQEARDYVVDRVKAALQEEHAREMSLQKARLQQQINRRIAALPENRRKFAEIALNKILKKFYGESDERISVIADVALDAMEHDTYWYVLNKIQEASSGTVDDFASSLEQFGLLELSVIGIQAASRRSFLEYLDSLSQKPETLEANMHQAIENSLWVLGRKYSLMASNVTLKSVVDKYTDKKYSGARSSKRPDLLLSQDYSDEFLLIEFKRPSHNITRSDVSQAEQYRDDITREMGSHVKMDVMLIGQGRAQGLDPNFMSPGVYIQSYARIISTSRSEIEWMIRSLQQL